MKLIRRSLKLIVIVLLLGGAPMAPGHGQVTTGELILYAFDSLDSTEPWLTVNDTVMGGVSKSGCRVTKAGTIEFSGAVSLENNGGFASVRVAMDSLDLSAYDEWVIRVCGDGKRYAMSVQTDYQIMAGAYYWDFQSEASQWQEIRAPMRAFEARSFGRPVRAAPALNRRVVRALGFMISDKQAGPFRIEIDWIKAVKSPQNRSPDENLADRDKARQAAMLIERAIGRGVPLFNAGQPEACAAIYETAAHCIVELSAPDLPGPVRDALRAGLAKAERTTDPAARAWMLRNAFDVSLRILAQDRRAKEASDG